MRTGLVLNGKELLLGPLNSLGNLLDSEEKVMRFWAVASQASFCHFLGAICLLLHIAG